LNGRSHHPQPGFGIDLEADLTGSSFYSVEKAPNGRSGGTTQAETRIYNERLVISLVRRHGQLSKADLTRLTGLAAQTISTIVNRATDNQLLIRREPLRGRLGQPSAPYALNPEAAHSFGLKIDHRSADIALINFVGNVVAFERTTFDYPTPSHVVAFAKATVARMCRKHKSIPIGRIAGLGIASPFYQGDWSRGIEGGDGSLNEWKQVDIRAELDRVFDWPVYLLNDGVVAAGAELMFGAGLARPDFLYAYIGYFIGGGLVLDHHLFPGRNKLAGAIGDIPVPTTRRHKDRSATLRDYASLKCLASRGRDRDDVVWSSAQDWSSLGGDLTEWIEGVSESLAHAARSATALVDVDCVVIDGAMPPAVRREIAKQTRRKLATSFLDRPEPFSVVEGSFGYLAPAIGGASIPLLVKYSNDKEILFKDDREAVSTS
jgi:predicted NBD/HSP70 family sugar kinase